MKDSKYLTAVPTDNPLCLALVDNGTGNAIVQYKISPYANLMQNAQLTSDIMEAYEKYFKSIIKK